MVAVWAGATVGAIVATGVAVSAGGAVGAAAGLAAWQAWQVSLVRPAWLSGILPAAPRRSRSDCPA